MAVTIAKGGVVKNRESFGEKVKAYIYTAPRPLAEIEGELTQIERDIADMLAEVTD